MMKNWTVMNEQEDTTRWWVGTLVGITALLCALGLALPSIMMVIGGMVVFAGGHPVPGLITSGVGALVFAGLVWVGVKITKRLAQRWNGFRRDAR